MTAIPVPAWSFSDQSKQNHRRVRLLLCGFASAVFIVAAVILAIVVALAGGPVLLAVVPALLVAASAAAVLSRRAHGMALARIGALPADIAIHARLHNLVEGLCASAGLAKPDLYVLDDPAPNACAVGRDPRHASVVVTSGLLENLTRIELEGVLAHELSHIKNDDVAVATLAVVLLGRVAPSSVASAIGANREAVADVTGVALTRYPPGLISALEKLSHDGAALRSPDRAAAHLWIEPPSTIPSQTPLEERIQALREL